MCAVSVPDGIVIGARNGGIANRGNTAKTGPSDHATDTTSHTTPTKSRSKRARDKSIQHLKTPKGARYRYRTVLSSEPEMAVLPSGVMPTDQTKMVWPSSTCLHSPVARSQTLQSVHAVSETQNTSPNEPYLTVLSPEPEMAVLPPGVIPPNQTHQTTPPTQQDTPHTPNHAQKEPKLSPFDT